MPYHVLITAMYITAYTICGGLLHTYVFSKAKKGRLLFSYTALASGMLLWPIVKLLEMIAPTDEIKEGYRFTEYGLALIFIASLLAFLIIVYHKKRVRLKAFIRLLSGAVIMIAAILLYLSMLRAERSVILLLILLSLLTVVLFVCKNSVFPEIEISLDNLVESGEERVAVFDRNGELIDRNLRALGNWFRPDHCGSLECLIQSINLYTQDDGLDLNIIRALPEEQYEKEICICFEDSKSYYVFRADRVKNRKGKWLGTVCFFQDITDNRVISMEQEQKNEELHKLNKELESYIKIADSLAEEKERAQIAREINHIIGQRLTEILSVLEVVKLTGSKDSERNEKLLDEAIGSCREVLAEIRVVVANLIPVKGRRGE